MSRAAGGGNDELGDGAKVPGHDGTGARRDSSAERLGAKGLECDGPGC